MKMKILKPTIFLVFLYGYETWSLTLREKHRRRAFEKRVMIKMLPLERKWQETGVNCIMRVFLVVLLAIYYWG